MCAISFFLGIVFLALSSFFCFVIGARIGFRDGVNSCMKIVDERVKEIDEELKK